MPTECSATLFEFARVEGRSVVGAFDGGKITSDAGALLLAATDRAVGLIDRFAGCFTDSRSPELVEHTVATLVGQRIFGIALGYEDVLDHDDLRHDPMMAVRPITMWTVSCNAICIGDSLGDTFVLYICSELLRRRRKQRWSWPH
jgi:hypothetical protein